jgi:acetyl esterase
MTNDNPFRAFFEKFTLPELPNMPAMPDLSKIKGPDWRATAENLRRNFLLATRSLEADKPEMAEISHLVVDGADGPLKARLYVPLGAGIGPKPGIVFYHGGGFVLGDLDTHEMLCMRLADAARCRVISVDYRLAPEHSFPAAHDDAIASWNWIIERAETLALDADRLAIAGDSAGGNLSAFVAQDTNRKKMPGPAFQLLLYPLVQFADIRTKKMTFQESGFFVSAGVFDYFRDSYLIKTEDRMDTRVSPLFSKGKVFRGLPPAHFVLCGWDPLKDEGRAYADKMASYGVPVTVREHKGMVHGFMNLTALSDKVREAIHDAGEVVGRALGAIEPPS